jgi:sugar-specific transcriptional regulator TrmB
MSNIRIPGIPGQAHTIYRILLKHQTLTAKDIARKLGIHPQHVYRSASQLLALGLISQLNTAPSTYRAKPLSIGRENYVTQQRKLFTAVFCSNMQISDSAVQNEKLFDVSFIQGRDEQLEQNIADIQIAKSSAKYIISALPIGIPVELIYTHKQAIERGVRFQIIAQDHTKENHNVLMSYKHIGAEVRHGKPLEWHLFLYDDDISHVMMYDPNDKLKQFGSRFVHRGVNQQLQQIFEKHWQEATAVE